VARKSVSESPASPGILPLQPRIVAHHEQVLLGPMREWSAQKRVPPVLLLTGTAGIGKREIGYHLAQWIFCERTAFQESEAEAGFDLFGGGGDASAGTTAEPLLRPCGECTACQRALHSNWVDFSEILPNEEDNASGALKIEQFRNLKARLGFGAHEGRYRIVLIPNAEKMTVQAANSVLKLLEEPPAGWVFFLTASDPTLLLPTIVSRCQTLRLKPFQREELMELLSEAGVSDERREICSQLAQGSWVRAIALASDEVWEQRQVIFAFLKEPGAVVNQLVDWAAQEDGNFRLLLDQLEQMTSELVRWSVSDRTGQKWISVDGKRVLEAHAARVVQARKSVESAREFWIARGERIAKARGEASAPLNRKLLTQDVLLPWLDPRGS